jgi:hypothetical protein
MCSRNRRVDFRELVSDMFALYKTRIWMAQVDMASAALDIGESISLGAGFLPHPSERLPDPMIENMIMSTSPDQSPSSSFGSALGARFGDLSFPSSPSRSAISHNNYRDAKTSVDDIGEQIIGDHWAFH